VGKLVLKSKHRLLCGSTANTEDVTRLMVGNRASCVFTDPPYGVAIGAKNRMLKSFRKAGSNLTDIVDDATTPEELKERLLPAFVNIRELVMANDCTLFVTAPQGGELGMMMMMMMKEAGLATRHVLIWKKNQPTFSMGRLDYDYAHEPILLTWGKKHKRPMGGEHRTSVWCIDRERKCAEHPTMKPVALYVNAYLNNSDAGDNVFDGYAGSGTAFVAAHQTCRRAFGMEIEPRYVQVCLERYAAFTGEQPILESTGQTFAEVLAQSTPIINPS
jgi:DNA modification methylase